MELRANIKKAWWRDMVHRRDDVVGLDSSIISSPQVWKASGHIDGFSDPMVDCKESKLRYRADQLFWARAEVDGELLGYVSLLETDDMQQLAEEAASKLKRKAKLQGTLTVSPVKDFTEATEEERELIPSPATGQPGSLTAPREFNLMFQTNVGAMADASSVAYLRPETAQGIFTNFKNVVATGRVKVPFGIAQIGKAFRNEITPRNFIFRSREFEQMEIEYFIPPDEDVWRTFHEQWLTDSYNFLLSIGLRPELISRDVHPDHKLAHYARACTDLMFKFPFGTQELQGVAARGCYDLTQHAESSGKSMEYFDEARKEKYVPHVIEPSIGVDRLMLAVLCSAYAEDEVGGEKCAPLLPSNASRVAHTRARSRLIAPTLARASRPLRQALRAALPSAPGADQGSGAAAGEEQAGAAGESAGHLRTAATALLRHLRRRGCDRPTLSSNGRGGHAVLHHCRL